METRELKNGKVAVDCDEDHYLHRKGDPNYSEIRHVLVRAEDASRYEEIPVSELEALKAEAECEKRYTARVEALIGQHYTIQQELAILRQRDTKPEEFDAYNVVAERCKAQARAEVYG